MPDVYAEVKSVVIPVRAVIPTPLPVGCHSFAISFDPTAAFTITSDVTVDPGAIVFQPAMAILSPVPICKCGYAGWQHKREC